MEPEGGVGSLWDGAQGPVEAAGGWLSLPPVPLCHPLNKQQTKHCVCVYSLSVLCCLWFGNPLLVLPGCLSVSPTGTVRICRILGATAPGYPQLGHSLWCWQFCLVRDFSDWRDRAGAGTEPAEPSGSRGLAVNDCSYPKGRGGLGGPGRL